MRRSAQHEGGPTNASRQRDAGRLIPPSRDEAPALLARFAIRSLWQELALYPKPGLVSLVDCGAHRDMDAATFVRSLFALRRYFAEVAVAGAAGAPLALLRDAGMRAERAMLAATSGVNTHRGAIFVLGLIAAAAARALAHGEFPGDAALRRIVARDWSAGLAGTKASRDPASHGELVAARFGVDGARGEAVRAFPSVFEVALPVLRTARRNGCDPVRSRRFAFFALLGSVADTNVLYRGGREGLAFVHVQARAFMAAGMTDPADELRRAVDVHRDFVARRLSPGGCADLLAAALFVDALQDRCA
jgi:triphosphoribosyl-dephospho-CoA synthase